MIDLQVALANHIAETTGTPVNPDDIPTVYAFDINDKGQVLVQVGVYNTIRPDTTGFVYIYQDGVFTDITQQLYVDNNLQYFQVKGLNNNGQIIAIGYRGGSSQDARSYIFNVTLNEPTVIVGGWGQGYYPAGIDNTGEAEYMSLTFYKNGIYIQYESGQPSENDNGGGVEIGKYSYDETAGVLTITDIITDENGDAGFAQWGVIPAPISAVVASDVLTLGEGAEARSFERVQ